MFFVLNWILYNGNVCEYNEKNKFYVKHDKQLSKEISQSPGLNSPAWFLMLFDLWLLLLFQ